MIFGVMTTACPRSSARFRRGQPAFFFRKLDSFARENGMTLIYFSPHAIDWRHGHVTGWVNLGTTDTPRWRWVQKALPDVVYENVFVHLAGTEPVRSARQGFTRRGIPLFNPAVGNKWALERYLRSQSRVRTYLPPTSLVRTNDDLWRALDQHQTVYLKPLGGSGGAGIVELKRGEGNQVRILSERFGSRGRIHLQLSRAAAQKMTRRWVRARSYLVQKGLDVISVDGRKVDFRVTLYRDGALKWQVAGVTPKLGRKQSIVTNSHAGGQKTSMEELHRLFVAHRIPVPQQQDLTKAAIVASEALSRRSPRLGLMGIDIAVDRNQRLWLLDFNPKPGRDLLNREMMVVAARCLAAYARRLALRQSSGAHSA